MAELPPARTTLQLAQDRKIYRRVRATVWLPLGFMFDIANMPKVLQGIALVVPARYFITLVRGIMLKGVGPSVLWPYGLGMLLFGAVGLAAAVQFVASLPNYPHGAHVPYPPLVEAVRWSLCATVGTVVVVGP